MRVVTFCRRIIVVLLHAIFFVDYDNRKQQYKQGTTRKALMCVEFFMAFFFLIGQLSSL